MLHLTSIQLIQAKNFIEEALLTISLGLPAEVEFQSSSTSALEHSSDDLILGNSHQHPLHNWLADPQSALAIMVNFHSESNPNSINIPFTVQSLY